MSKPVKIRAERIVKLFGDQPEEAQRRLQEGASKDEVYRETGSVVAVSGVSFEVPQGEVFVVMGLSGSGKSTLIRCINRLIEPTSGYLYLDEEDLLAADEKHLREIRRTKMAMVFQHFALLPHRTVGQNVEYGLKIRGVDRRTRREQALNALEQVGLRDWADSMPQQLSGGMQQRVGLARGLASDPEVLLMDEPFSALDPLIRRDMQQELLQLQRKMNKTIIFITHDLHEALILGDQIAIMKDGRFVQIGTPEEIVGAPADPYVKAFTQDVDRGRVFSLGTVMEKPEALQEGDTVDEARARLESLEREALYVIDAESKPLGVVSATQLADSNTPDLASLVQRDFPSGRPEDHLIDIYRECATGLPVAVLDTQGRLQGTVEPRAVFRELARGMDNGGESAESRSAPVR
ncbi:MAG: glycine betaine/L-proline ABC transporter ATP-binding protein [Candidatus Competibacterales bacterium]|nr:glycine betaine/L-proline ABC transporter ATP-binding protein [Candidatus Competibacterales bacterium]